MNKNLEQLKFYLNKNGLRFKLNEKRIWNYIIDIFGENRARELSKIFDETYISEGKAQNVDRKYKFCKSFEEATALMYFQSDWFLKNCDTILEDILKNKPQTILELGCYSGLFSNYLTTISDKISVTGIDIEKNLITFGQEKFKNKKLNLINLDYKNLNKLNKNFDYIFTNFGLEEIPQTKFNSYKIRDNQNYKSKLNYFYNFFSFLDKVSKEQTEFFCLARIATLEGVLAIIDAAHKNGWKWLNNEFDYIECSNEIIPKLKFIKKKSNQIEINSFINETLKFKNKENNELYQIEQFENEKLNLILLNRDSYKFEQTKDELFYEIYKSNNLYALFAWSTLGYILYKKFKNKNDLVKLFTEETGLEIDSKIINS